MNKIISLLLLACTFSVYASENTMNTASFLYGESDAETSDAIIQTSDGGYLASGSSYAIPGLILKLDSQMHVQWAMKVPEFETYAYRTILEMKDGYILNSRNTILKLDRSGHIKWHKKFIRIITSNISRLDASTIAFSTVRFGHGFTVWKLTSDGNLLSKRFYSFRGCGGAPPKSILTVRNGGLIVSGQEGCSGQTTGIFLMKLKRNGKVEWEKRYHAEGWAETVTSLVKTQDGYFIAAQAVQQQPFHTALVFREVDFSGNIQWEKTYQGSIAIRNLKELGDGNFVVLVTPPRTSKAGLLKLDSQGNSVFLRSYTIDGHSGELKDLDVTRDGGMLLTGSAKSTATHSQDFWILKLDSNGEMLNSSCIAMEERSLIPGPQIPVSTDDRINTLPQRSSLLSTDIPLTVLDFAGIASICN